MKFVLFIFIFLNLSPNVYATVMTYSEVQALAKTVLREGNFELTNIKINDIETFCPNYSSFSVDEKEDFFAYLVAEISDLESGNDTNNIFLENNGNLSAGLLQISYGSISNKYKQNGCSDIKLSSDLKDARKNLECGLGIISTLAKSKGYLSNNSKGGASSYWSTLRTPYNVYVKALKKTVKVGKKYVILADLRKKDQRCFTSN